LHSNSETLALPAQSNECNGDVTPTEPPLETGSGVTFASMKLRQCLWRVVAGLILVGTVADLTFGLLFLTGIKRTISYGTLEAIYWIPPAIERPSSLVHFLGHVAPTIAWLALVTTAVFSLLLAYGLWKERLWAGWIETVLMVYSGVVLVNLWWRYFAPQGAKGLNDFFMVGNGPALLWVLIFLALLWTNQLTRLAAKSREDSVESTQRHVAL